MAIVTYRRYRIEDEFESEMILGSVLNEVPRNYTLHTGSIKKSGRWSKISHYDYTFNPANQTFELTNPSEVENYYSSSRKDGVRWETGPYYCKIETISIASDTGFQRISGYEYRRVITLLDASVSAEEGTYPADGAHTDGYWYRINTPFSFEMPTNTTYERMKLYSGEWRYFIRWSSLYGMYILDGKYVQSTDKDWIEFSYRLSPEDPFNVDKTVETSGYYYAKRFPLTTDIKQVEFRIRYYSDERGYSNPLYVPLDAFDDDFPTVKTKINGAEKKIVQAHAKVNGVLKPITKIYTKVGGQLKEL